MIWLHKLNGEEFILNSRHIEKIEAVPDTTIMLTNDRYYIVKESCDEVIAKIIEYSRRSLTGN